MMKSSTKKILREVRDEEQKLSRIQVARESPEDYLPNLPAKYRSRIAWNGSKTVEVYRAVVDGVTEIEPGEWVALERSYATTHGRGNILTMRVPASDIYWAGTDFNEWFYIPR